MNNYNELLYPLKKDKIEGAKLLLNIISGLFGEMNKTKHIIEKDNGYRLPANNTIMSINPSLFNDSEVIIKTANNDDYFTSNFARLKPFMLATARANISELILPYNEFVVKSNIDSIVAIKDLPFKTGDNIGELKVEYKNLNIKIKNNAKEQFENI
jgi:hypothetical protein